VNDNIKPFIESALNLLVATESREVEEDTESMSNTLDKVSEYVTIHQNKLEPLSAEMKEGNEVETDPKFPAFYGILFCHIFAMRYVSARPQFRHSCNG
jgi:hypothetical protein